MTDCTAPLARPPESQIRDDVALHAKCALAEESLLPVSSANLTEAALGAMLFFQGTRYSPTPPGGDSAPSGDRPRRAGPPRFSR